MCDVRASFGRTGVRRPGVTRAAQADTAGGTIGHSSFFLVAYSDAHATVALVSVFSATSTGFRNFGSAIFTSAPATVSSTGSSVIMSTLSTGDPCHDISGLVNPLGPSGTPIEYAPSVCHLATFSAGITATFPPTAGLDQSLQTIQIPPQTVNGIRVLNSPVFE